MTDVLVAVLFGEIYKNAVGINVDLSKIYSELCSINSDLYHDNKKI